MHDSRGVPIYPGDLLRSPHFVERNGRKHYLYHVAVADGDRMDMVPTCHLEASKVAGGGRCPLTLAIARGTLVIHGHGPEPHLDYTDRPKAGEDAE